MDADTVRFVREEIKRQLSAILSGQAGDNSDVETETIDNLFPGSPSIEKRPVMHPYGFASRAPQGTISVTARQGNDPSNRVVLGHRDSLRSGLPEDLGAGDSVIYASDGKTVLARIVLVGKVATITNDKGTILLAEDGTITASNDNGSVTLAADGSIQGKASGGSGFNVGAGKAAIGGTSAGEVVAAFAQALNLLATDATPGFGGPLTNAAQYQLLYQKINPTVGSLP
jgi:phage gp45-like